MRKIEADIYAKDVISGKITAGKYVKLACERHLKNYKNKDLYMNYSRIDKVINFIENHLRHFEGEYRGKKIKLENWQKFILQNIFGWSYKKNDKRLYKYAYMEVARKNGKSTLAAIIVIVTLILDKDPTPQVIIGANDEKQAKITLHITSKILEISPSFKPFFKQKNIKINTHGGKATAIIVDNKNRQGFAEAISNNLDTKDGSNPSLGVIDEFHAAKDDGLLNVLESGQAARKEPLIFVTTTAGFNKDGPCYSKLRNTSTQVLDGSLIDERNFCIIYTIDEDDDPEDPKNWIKSNPMIESIESIQEFLADRMVRTKNEGGTKYVEFLTKNFNIWSDTEEIWIPSDIYKAGYDKDYEEKHDLTQYDCWGGLDLASTKDISAFALCWKIGEKYYKKEWYWCPEEGFEKRVNDGFTYDIWYEKGLIKLTPGNIADYRVIEEDIAALNDIYNIKFINYDRKDAFQLINILSDDHLITCEPFTQNHNTYHTPMTEFESNLYRKVMFHDNNLVTNWMMSNVVPRRRRTDGAIMPSKKNDKSKIDGAVADIMAFAGAYEVEVDTTPGIINI